MADDLGIGPSMTTRAFLYFQDGLIVRVRAYLDSAMVARLFEENPIDLPQQAAD